MAAVGLSDGLSIQLHARMLFSFVHSSTLSLLVLWLDMVRHAFCYLCVVFLLVVVGWFVAVVDGALVLFLSACTRRLENRRVMTAVEVRAILMLLPLISFGMYMFTNFPGSKVSFK